MLVIFVSSPFSFVVGIMFGAGLFVKSKKEYKISYTLHSHNLQQFYSIRIWWQRHNKWDMEQAQHTYTRVFLMFRYHFLWEKVQRNNEL